MLKTLIAVIALAALPASPAEHEVWEADISLASTSPVFVLQLDEELTAATNNLTFERLDVVDAKGQTMPRGFFDFSGDGPHQDVVLALTQKREQRAQPLVCEQPKRPQECTAFDREPDFAEPEIAMAQRVARMPNIPTSYAMHNRGSGTNGGILINVRTNAAVSTNGAGGIRLGSSSVTPAQPAIPLRYDVVETASPPDDAGLWSHRTLVLTWKSRLPPTAIAWQVGYNVAQITPGDRALLDEGGALPNDWNPRLSRAWHRFGRMVAFSSLKGKQNDDGSWQAEVPLKGLVGNTVLQIASAPVGAVEFVDVHLQGVAPRTSPQTSNVERSIELKPIGEGRWKVVDAWPKKVLGVSMRFTLEQSLAIMDSGLEKFDYQTKTASGLVKTVTVRPFDTFANANALDGIGSMLPFDSSAPWIELQQLSPAQPLPAPRLKVSNTLRSLWFDNAGTPPYRLRIGAKSARREDWMTAADGELLGRMGMPPTTIKLPMATVTNARKVQVLVEEGNPSAPSDPNSRLAKIVAMFAMFAMFAVAALIALNHSLRRKIAARSGASK